MTRASDHVRLPSWLRIIEGGASAWGQSLPKSNDEAKIRAAHKLRVYNYLRADQDLADKKS